MALPLTTMQILRNLSRPAYRYLKKEVDGLRPLADNAELIFFGYGPAGEGPIPGLVRGARALYNRFNDKAGRKYFDKHIQGYENFQPENYAKATKHFYIGGTPLGRAQGQHLRNKYMERFGEPYKDPVMGPPRPFPTDQWFEQRKLSNQPQFDARMWGGA